MLRSLSVLTALYLGVQASCAEPGTKSAFRRLETGKSEDPEGDGMDTTSRGASRASYAINGMGCLRIWLRCSAPPWWLERLPCPPGAGDCRRRLEERAYAHEDNKGGMETDRGSCAGCKGGRRAQPGNTETIWLSRATRYWPRCRKLCNKWSGRGDGGGSTMIGSRINS